jgi:hypothetical protein
MPVALNMSPTTTPTTEIVETARATRRARLAVRFCFRLRA